MTAQAASYDGGCGRGSYLKMQQVISEVPHISIHQSKGATQEGSRLLLLLLLLLSSFLHASKLREGSNRASVENLREGETKQVEKLDFFKRDQTHTVVWWYFGSR